MNTKSLVYPLLVLVATGALGCAKLQRSGPGGAEAGETKVRLEQVPAPVRQTIERELLGARLEDIALKKRQGQTVCGSNR